MVFEEFLTMVGLGELVAEDFFVAQVALMSVTALLFLASLVLCAMAFRAAGAARGHARAANDLAAEMRHLTAQVELSTKRRAIAPAVPATGGEPSAALANGSGEAPQEAAAAETHGVYADEWEKSSGKSLEAAKEAATVPSALIGAIWRRNKH